MDVGLPEHDSTPVIEATPRPGRLLLAVGALVSVALIASACGTWLLGVANVPLGRSRSTPITAFTSCDPMARPDADWLVARIRFGPPTAAGSPSAAMRREERSISSRSTRTGLEDGAWSPWDSSIDHEWSPDGTKLAFAGLPDHGGGGGWDIYVIDADGGDPRQPTFDETDEAPRAGLRTVTRSRSTATTPHSQRGRRVPHGRRWVKRTHAARE